MILRYIYFAALLFATRTENIAGCGYQSCNPVKDGMINVHLVPHTHDDVGWLKTVDQYYYGDKDDIQVAGVQYILDSVIDQLLKDPRRRFIYVEIAFFARWWNEQNDNMKSLVKELVMEGRLEFILGGWSMDDEATTHYNAIIDEHTLGFEFLHKNFGECGRPRVAWQIDPFGHSREQASLFAHMGFDGLFFGRLDYQDKDERMKTKTMEMVWEGSPKNLGAESNLFTGALFHGYNPPPTFCFDVTCRDHPIMDDERMHDYNVDKRVEDFLNYTRYQSESYATSHLIMTMGSDFNYLNANMWYKNLDKLIHYVNLKQMNGSKINLLYSTPSCYLYHLNQANLTWPSKQDDFFPYAHIPHAFWTGFYTSRPTLKRYVRETNNFLQVCKQLDVIAQLPHKDDRMKSIQLLKEAVAVAQHHDAVSGTEKQAVAYDYALRLAEGSKVCQNVINSAFEKLLPLSKHNHGVPEQVFCTLMNISFCHLSENNKKFTVTAYNPIGHEVIYWMRIPIVGTSFTVLDPVGNAVIFEVVPIGNDTKRIPERNASIADHELVFPALIPPLGFSTYFINTNKDGISSYNKSPLQITSKTNGVIQNKFLSVTFDSKSGDLIQIKNLKSGVSTSLNQRFQYYISHYGNQTVPKFQGSGAYIFRPNQTDPLDFNPAFRQNLKVIQGKLVQEIHQSFSSWVTQVIRLYEDAQYLEFEWTVGPIPEDDHGKEVITKYCSDLKSKGVFYTDSNGREILTRKLDYRPTWKFNNTEPVAGNYFPINSKIFLQDEDRKVQLSVLTDRSQGGSSLQDGCLEIMVHRRLVVDDNLGVGEALNETGSDGKGLVARGKHYLYMDTIANSAALHREKSLQLYMMPSLSFTDSQLSQKEWSKLYRTKWSALTRSLPDNVHLLTLEKWSGLSNVNSSAQSYLIRLEHIYERGEAGHLSDPVKISLEDLFVEYHVTSITELTLGANMKLQDLKRLQWKYKSNKQDYEIPDNTLNFMKRSIYNETIVLRPMQIRTFGVTLSTKIIKQ